MTILLPSSPGTRHARIEPIDTGFLQRNANGAAERIERPGSRYRVTFSWPVMTPDTARPFVVRLERGRRERVRVPISLLGESQGAPGSAVVNGSDSGGTTLKLRSATPGYVFKEGYWLTLVHAEIYHLHKVSLQAIVAGDGTVTLQLEPPLRVFPADGAAVLIEQPWIEGFVVDLQPIEHPVNRRIQLTATIEETA